MGFTDSRAFVVYEVLGDRLFRWSRRGGRGPGSTVGRARQEAAGSKCRLGTGFAWRAEQGSNTAVR
jgi:hypothetical protein